MPEKEEEEKRDKREEGKKGEGEEPKSKKSNALLWWGLGIGAVGLVITLLLFGRGNSGGGSQPTTVNGSMPFQPNGTDTTTGSQVANNTTGTASQYSTPNNAQTNDYWPPLNGPGAPGSYTNPSQVPAGTPGYSHATGIWGNNSGYTGNSSNSGSTSSNNNTSNNNNTPPSPNLPSKNAYVYTTQAGDTLNSLTQKFNWTASQQKGGGPQFTYNYGNNADIFSTLGINLNNPNQAIPAGTRINA
jgi:LysM repeat protein